MSDTFNPNDPGEPIGTDGIMPDAGGGQQQQQRQPDSGGQQQQQQRQPDTTPLEAPAHWDSAAREMFGKVPREAQQYLLDRSRDMDAAHTRRSQEVAGVRSFMEKVNGYARQLNVQPDFVVDQAFQIHQTLANGTPQQKIAALKQLVESYGIQAPGADAPPQDPRVDALTTELQTLRQDQQSQLAQQQRARTMQVSADIQALISEKDDQGNLVNPYYADVEPEMMKLAQADMAQGIVPNVKDLYDRACWTTPSVRDRILAGRQKQSQQEQANQARQARQASSTVGGTGGAPNNQPMSLRETLDAAWDGRLNGA